MNTNADYINSNMKYLYSIRDKRGNYGNPCVFANDQTAIRSFQDMVLSDDGLIKRHPEDFDLFLIATWDNITGLIEHIEPAFLACASEFFSNPVKKAENE